MYFADRLPALQLHYDVDDPIVPLRNGEAIARAARGAEVHFYPGYGHDADRAAAYAFAREFFRTHLFSR